MPFRIAFITEQTIPLTILETTVDIFFGLDLIVNFFSAYDGPDGMVVTDHRLIAKNYITGWFVLDVIACIPTQLVELAN